MDGLSIVTSVAGIASLAIQLTQVLHDYCSNVRSAFKDIENLAQEMEALGKVLKRLETFLDEEDMKGNRFDQSASVLASAIKTCGATLRDLEKSLKGPAERSAGKFIERLMWPFRKEEVQKMVESLRRYNHIFQFS